MFLVVIDAHSKWLKVHPMPTIMALTTIQHLRTIIASFGLPERVVSDDAPTFTSWEFRNFVRENGVEHVMCALYHPATNGLVERVVWTFKRGVNKSKNGGMHIEPARFLFSYRIIQSTVELLMVNLTSYSALSTPTLWSACLLALLDRMLSGSWTTPSSPIFLVHLMWGRHSPFSLLGVCCTLMPAAPLPLGDRGVGFVLLHFQHKRSTPTTKPPTVYNTPYPNSLLLSL